MSRDAITKLEQERQKKQIEQTLEEASWDIPRLLKINARLVKEKHAQAEQIEQAKADNRLLSVGKEVEKTKAENIYEDWCELVDKHKQQAEQIKSLCDGIDKVNNEAVKHRRENKRLKADMAEEIRISIKVSNEKLAENQRLKELLCRAKKYADIQREYELVEEIEQALAAQPQKESEA